MMETIPWDTLMIISHWHDMFIGRLAIFKQCHDVYKQEHLLDGGLRAHGVGLLPTTSPWRAAKPRRASIFFFGKYEPHQMINFFEFSVKNGAVCI